ncbi:hypothetical protein [Citrobacter sp. Cpo102]|uniref:hypothetical protein n=1 Tax=Citrobacter sp. Cpo102 TaxID=2985142 RepID=UPI002576233D|nr:hypothetical protein [Citrobacter sp. Cpo102]MDM2817098.1 hypothetical protein [Citrobacter sp. Cpo102]
MEITRALIVELSKKEKPINKLVKEFQNGEISEDELVSRSISWIYNEFINYKKEVLNNESSIW